jgi:Mce-associated membrane protein
VSSGPAPRRRRIAGERRRASERPEDQTEDQAEEAGSPVESPPASSPEPSPGPAPAPPRGPRRWIPKKKVRTRTPKEPRAAAADRGRSRPRLLVAIPLVLLTILGLTYLVLAFVGVPRMTDYQDVREAEQARVAAESAPSIAERAAEAILAYDHRRIDADQEAAARFMTSSFAEEYATTFERAVKPAARNYRARVTVAVQGSSVIRASSQEVKVLLFLDQTTQSTAHQQPQVALNRVQFVMVPEGGTWKVDEISSF